MVMRVWMILFIDNLMKMAFDRRPVMIMVVSLILLLDVSLDGLGNLLLYSLLVSMVMRLVSMVMLLVSVMVLVVSLKRLVFCEVIVVIMRVICRLAAVVFGLAAAFWAISMAPLLLAVPPCTPCLTGHPHSGWSGGGFHILHWQRLHKRVQEMRAAFWSHRIRMRSWCWW